MITKINSKEDYDKLINGCCIIKFSADWCYPCKRLEATINELDPNRTNNIPFYEINVDDAFADEITEKLNVRGIPVLFSFKDGNVVESLVGAVGSDKIYNMIEKL